MAEQTEGVIGGAAQGAAVGAAVGGVPGAIIGGALGGLGGLFGGKSKKKARKAKRKAAASRAALSGLQAARARRRVVQDAIRARSQIVSQTTAAGVKGSGVSGAVSSVSAQAQEELGFAAGAQQLATRAGIFETKAAKHESRAATISAFTSTIFQVGAVAAGGQSQGEAIGGGAVPGDAFQPARTFG